MEKTHGTIIRTIKLTETSLIICWCTADFGLIKTVAKGARRPRSPFAGKLDLFHEAELDFARSRKSDLHTLRDLAISDHRHGIRSRYPRILAASYFVRLIELSAEPESPIREIHLLLCRALGFLEDQDPTQRAVLFFEKELCRLIGISESEVNPASTLADIYGRLPSQREELLRRMTT